MRVLARIAKNDAVVSPQVECYQCGCQGVLARVSSEWQGSEQQPAPLELSVLEQRREKVLKTRNPKP